ncbi:unnamed protein product, partial [Heterosigma akashiwo]
APCEPGGAARERAARAHEVQGEEPRRRPDQRGEAAQEELRHGPQGRQGVAEVREQRQAGIQKSSIKGEAAEERKKKEEESLKISRLSCNNMKQAILSHCCCCGRLVHGVTPFALPFIYTYSTAQLGWCVMLVLVFFG